MRARALAVIAAFTTVGPTVEVAAQAETYYPPVWYKQGMVPTIGADATASLQSRINATPDGGTLTLEAGAKFRVDGTLRISNRRNFTLNGNGASIYAITSADRNRRHVSILNGSNIRVIGLTVLGANPNAGTGDFAYRPDREAQHAFEVLGSKTVELANLKAYDVYGDFVYIGLGATAASNVSVHDNTFARNGRQGVTVTAGLNVLIERNNISEVRRTTFDLEPNSPAWVVDGVTIRSNSIGTGRLNFLSAVGNGPVNRVTVASNVLRGKSLNALVRAPEGTRRTGWSFTGNSSDLVFGTPSMAALHFFGTDDISVTGNYQPLQAGRSMVGVNSHDGCRVVVSGNQFPGGVGANAPLADC